MNHQMELINEGFDHIQDPGIDSRILEDPEQTEQTKRYFYSKINEYLTVLLARFPPELDEEDLLIYNPELLVGLYYDLFINPDDIQMDNLDDLIDDMMVTGKKRKNNKKNSIKSKKRNSSTKNKKHKKKTLKTKRKKKYTK